MGSKQTEGLFGHKSWRELTGGLGYHFPKTNNDNIFIKETGGEKASLFPDVKAEGLELMILVCKAHLVRVGRIRSLG